MMSVNDMIRQLHFYYRRLVGIGFIFSQRIIIRLQRNSFFDISTKEINIL